MLKIYSLLKEYRRQSLVTQDYPIHFYNFWKQDVEDIWFYGYFKSKGYFAQNPKLDIAFFSALGKRQMLTIDKIVHLSGNRKRFFFSGENLHYDRFKDYQKHLLDDRTIDLALGFDEIADERYLRFPIWILEMFPPNSTTGDIKKVCHTLSQQKFTPERNKFCAMVSGNSRWLGEESHRLRNTLFNELNAIAPVDSAGKFLHNCDDLQTKFGDNKQQFLRQYAFFICPENSDERGYVTEKLFHSIEAGCLPVYRGSNNQPEPGVLNRDAIIFWNAEGDNTQNLAKIEELRTNKKLLKDFFEQPRLQPNAWEAVAGYFERLEKKVKLIVSANHGLKFHWLKG